MNLINEQSVTTSTITITTTTATTTTTAKELSPAQASSRRRRVVRTSLESSLAAENTAASPSLSLSSLPAAEAAASLTFESIARSSIPCTAAKSSTSLVESINRQIEKISNSNLNSNIDAYQLNLIKKMPATITKTAVTASQSVAAGVAAVAASVGSNTTTTVSDVSEGMKNRNGNGDNSAPTTTTTTTPTTPTEKERKIGCEHYKRRAMFVTPCCNKFYKCRYCHDEKETHHFDRKTLTELICVECNTRQKVQEQCEKCGVRFGKYTCLICNLFDDEDKNQYHCDDCGICRIGGRENFFHCEVCNMCLPIELKIQGHRCVENISRSNCPVCLGAIHTSRIPCHIPDCGHLLHKMCFDQLLASGHYVCPTCQTSLLDMTKMWEYLDAQALLMAVPKKYENQRVYIFCNDCHETCKTKFHFVGLKCIHCGGYNTTQDVKRRMSWANGADSSTSA